MKKTAIRVSLFLSVIILSAASLTWAGDLDAPAGPTDPGSAMFTLEDLYKRLDTGATGVKRSGPFAEPAAAPGSTMHNLNDIMSKAPATDDTAGAGPEHVLSGKTFWGLQSGEWGPRTGTRVGGVILKAGGNFSPEKRWYDNADGTITDVRTGLVWLKVVSTATRKSISHLSGHTDMFKYATRLPYNNAALTDGSGIGDWRVPTLKEMQSLMVGPEAIGGGNLQGFSASTAEVYWTSSQGADYLAFSTINIVTGLVGNVQKFTDHYADSTSSLLDCLGCPAADGSYKLLVWPVRNALLP